jgi:hypothetical protein
MRTAFYLLALYDGLPVIPVDRVCKDFFVHLSPDMFIRKCSRGDIHLPLLRIERGQKSAKGIHVEDLANYIDKQREAAQKELSQMTGTHSTR